MAQVDTVTVGMKFRASVGDANALWEVTRRRGPQVWEATVINEPFTDPDGTEIDGDYVGTTQVFDAWNIIAAQRLSNFFDDRARRDRDAIQALPVGGVIHQNNSWDQWLRGTVVEDAGEKKLRVDALVGDWRDVDLPRRLADGTINVPFHVEKVGTAIKLRPDSIWECDLLANRGRKSDPTGLPAIDLTVAEPTEHDKQQYALVRLLNQIRSTAQSGAADKDRAQDAVDEIRRLLNDAPSGAGER